MGGGRNSTGASTSHGGRKPDSANTEQKLDEITSDQIDRRQEYNVFISHSWDYSHHYENLTDMFDNKNYFQYSDYSVPEAEPLEANNHAQLHRDLKRRVKNSSVLVATSGMYLSNSTWMKAEVDMAKETGTPVVAVQPRGNQRLPAKVKEDADKVVGWQTDSVVDSIREVSE